MAEGNNLQNTSEWYSARLYHFTSSEVYNLMGEPRSKADKEAGKLTATAESYILDKVAEFITAGTCLDYQQTNRAIEWGNHYEQYAIEAYEKRMGTLVGRVGFIEYNKYFGGSPDGLVGEDGLIEVKCPYSCTIHAQHCLLETQEDLLRFNPKYYAQIQGNLLVTGRKWAHFVSYDPRVQNDKLALKVLLCPRNEDFIRKIQVCVDRAGKVLEEYKKRLISQLQ